MIYGASDLCGSQGMWRTTVGKGQTGTPCRESLSMETLFSGYLGRYKAVPSVIKDTVKLPDWTTPGHKERFSGNQTAKIVSWRGAGQREEQYGGSTSGFHETVTWVGSLN